MIILYTVLWPPNINKKKKGIKNKHSEILQWLPDHFIFNPLCLPSSSMVTTCPIYFKVYLYVDCNFKPLKVICVE